MNYSLTGAGQLFESFHSSAVLRTDPIRQDKWDHLSGPMIELSEEIQPIQKATASYCLQNTSAGREELTVAAPVTCCLSKRWMVHWVGVNAFLFLLNVTPLIIQVRLGLAVINSLT